MADILERRLIISEAVTESSVGDETVLLHLDNGTYYGLDRVATEIWAMLKERIATRDICRKLANDYRVDLADIEADARRFLAELEAQGIIADA